MSDDLLPKWAQNLNTQAVYDVSKRILENNQALKEENKRLREALEKVFDGSAFPGFLIVENPDRMTDILEYINETARQALKEE